VSDFVLISGLRPGACTEEYRRTVAYFEGTLHDLQRLKVAEPGDGCGPEARALFDRAWEVAARASSLYYEFSRALDDYRAARGYGRRITDPAEVYRLLPRRHRVTSGPTPYPSGGGYRWKVLLPPADHPRLAALAGDPAQKVHFDVRGPVWVRCLKCRSDHAFADPTHDPCPSCGPPVSYEVLDPALAEARRLDALLDPLRGLGFEAGLRVRKVTRSSVLCDLWVYQPYGQP
jgi:hypothetical protein